MNNKYIRAPIKLLDSTQPSERAHTNLNDSAIRLETELRKYKANVQVVNVSNGPSYTRYEIKLVNGTRISQITRIKYEIQMILESDYINIIAPIPGKITIGIDVRNGRPQIIKLRSILESPNLQYSSPLVIGLGRDTTGHPIIFDISKYSLCVKLFLTMCVYFFVIREQLNCPNSQESLIYLDL